MRVPIFMTAIAKAIVVSCLVFVASPAWSAEVRDSEEGAIGDSASDQLINSTFSISAFETPTVGYLTPSMRSVAFGALPGEPTSLNGATGGLVLADAFDIAGKYTADLYGGRIGFYGGYADRPSTLALTPDTAWNFGALVGYAGFYVRGGISDMTTVGYVQDVEGWEAGFGYETGNLDLRLTYAASQSVGELGAVERQLDSKQWTLGGDYQVTPRLRLNANAFYDIRDSGFAVLSFVPTTAAPQGTGARVGVQLRF